MRDCVVASTFRDRLTHLAVRLCALISALSRPMLINQFNLIFWLEDMAFVRGQGTRYLSHAAGRTECNGHVELFYFGQIGLRCNQETIRLPAVMQLFSLEGD